MRRTAIATCCILICALAVANDTQAYKARPTRKHSQPKMSLEKAWMSTVEAIDKGDLAKVRRLLDGNSKLISLTSVDGRTLLHIAASRWNTEIARFLLDRGASVNTRDNDGSTPLHRAVQLGRSSVPMSRLLLSRRANAQARDNRGRTPMHDCCLNKDLVGLLIANGGIIGAKDNWGNTPLHIAAFSGLSLAKDPERVLADRVSYLIQKGADPNAPNDRGRTPLHQATTRAAAKALIAGGADIGALDRDGNTPLHTLSRDAAQVLMESGADVNARNSRGRTPLSFSSSAPFQGGKAELLLAHGAKVDTLDQDGLTPLLVWCSENSPLFADFGTMKVLVDNGANTGAKGSHGRTPLHYVAMNDNTRAAKFLIESYAVVDALDDDGNTPLHLAVTNENKAVAKVLLNSGADVNARNAEDKTPLGVALDPDIADLLRNHGGSY